MDVASAQSLWDPVGVYLNTASVGLPPRPADALFGFQSHDSRWIDRDFAGFPVDDHRGAGRHAKTRVVQPDDGRDA